MNQDLLTISNFKDSQIMIVALSDNKVKKEKLSNYLEQLKKKVWERYHEKIKNWDGCLDDFEDCGQIFNIKSDSENFFGFSLDKETSTNVLGLL